MCSSDLGEGWASRGKEGHSRQEQHVFRGSEGTLLAGHQELNIIPRGLKGGPLADSPQDGTGEALRPQVCGQELGLCSEIRGRSQTDLSLLQ